MAKVAQSRRNDIVWWLNHHYPDVWYNLESALDAALKHGDIQLAERFIEYGSNWPTSDNLPHEIAALGNLPVLQWLLKQAEFENVAGLVVKAAGKGHLQVVRWLLHCRVRSSDEVRFAIHSAAVHGHLEVAKFLREKEKESLTTQLSSEDPLSPKSDQKDKLD
ncbi:Ankyrin repeat-containing domain [Phytophthora cactorum]|nr:Ankyrin repeat-containing domain [Phytophthora cactorum]